MKTHFLLLGATFFLVMLSVGCGNNIHTIEAANNGYLCSACQKKFYTGKDVFAVACPKCKSYEIKEVVAYVCPQQHEIIDLRGKSVMCPVCKATASVVQFPKEQALKNWGAAKATRSEVSKR